MKNISCLFAYTFLLSVQPFTVVDASPSRINHEEACPVSRRIVRRAAFDIGSVQIKMQVSDIDLCANKIAKVLLTDSAAVPLREDLAKNQEGKLSDEIQIKMINSISQLMKKAASFNPEEYHGIATESLRLAKNGASFVERIRQETGLSVTIISQDEEGILGFISAINEADIDPDKAVSWDLGGGSFQITAKCGDRYMVYQGKHGKVPFKNALLKIQGKELNDDSGKTQSPNPISKADFTQAVQFIKENLTDFPLELRQKFNQPNIVVLGIGINPLGVMQNHANYDKHRILTEIENRLHLDDRAISIKNSISTKRKKVPPYAAYIVSNLILAYGIMDALGIDRVHYAGTRGANSVGALLSPTFWKNNETFQNDRQPAE